MAPQLLVAVPKWRKYLYRSLFICILIVFGICIHYLNVPSRAPELLPLPPANPTSDGSYPELLIQNNPANPGVASFEVSYTRNSPSFTHDSPINQFDLNLSTGRFVVRQTDLFDAGTMPLSLTRTYDSFGSNVRSFGIGTSQPYDAAPSGSRNPYTYIDLNLEDGDAVHFERVSKGTGFADAIYEHRATSSKEFFGARIHWNGEGWNLSLPDGSTLVFPDGYYAKTFAQAGIREIRSASGQSIKVDRSPSGDIKSVISSSGHRMDFSYDNSGRIVEVRDDLGGHRQYLYDSNGCLQFVSNGTSLLYQFEYVRTLMTSIIDARGKEILAISYIGGRVSTIRLTSGEMYSIRYDIDSANHVIRTVVSNPTGHTSEYDFR